MEGTRSPKKVFVSYAGGDQQWATWIAAVVRDHGHAVTVQPVDFVPGKNFVLEMQTALTAADHVMPVLSPNYERSRFALAEWAAAFADDPVGVKRRVIGVRVVDYVPSGLLRTVVYVDLVGRSEDEAVEAILAAINPDEHSAAQARFPGPPGHPTRQRAWLSGAPTVPPHCVIRQQDLAELSELLADSGRAVITGIGGLGKSSLARRWLHDNAELFDLVIWMHAPDEQRLQEAVLRAAIALDLVPDEADPPQALAKLRASATRSTLVVLDDCPDGSVVVSVFPGATVLATSRNDRGWSPLGFRQLRLAPWDLEVATTYLVEAAPSTGVAAAPMVVERLGGLPLAIAQAATYIDSAGLSGEQYLERLAEYATRLFDTPLGSEYGHTVLSVWSVALDDLRRDHPAAAELLDLIAFLYPDNIPLNVLLSFENLPAALAGCRDDAVLLDSTLAALLRQSLCAIGPEGISVHPLIQSVVASRLEDDKIREIVRVVLDGLRHTMPDDTSRDAWPVWERLGPHIDAIYQAAITFGVHATSLRSLLTAYSEAMTSRGFPHFGTILRAQVLEYINEHRDDFSPADLAAAAHDLGNSYSMLQASEAAVASFRTALAIDGMMGTLGTPRSLASQVGLVGALTDTGEHSSALEIIATAAAAYEEGDEKDPQLGVTIYGTWGRLLSRMDRAAEARPYLDQALELALEADLLAEVAFTHLHIGNSDLSTGDIEGARECYLRALDSAGRIPNEYHLRASILQNLATIDLMQDKYPDALTRLEQALAELGHLPEGDFTVLSALIHYHRAQIVLNTGADIQQVVVEAGTALDVFRAHLPWDHQYPQMAASFLLGIADRLDDDELRSMVDERLRAPERRA